LIEVGVVVVGCKLLRRASLLSIEERLKMAWLG